MREIIMTGKTVEEATERACAELGLARDEISIEILEMPQKKLFKTIPAKVKATADNEVEMPKAQPVKDEKAQPEKAAHAPAQKAAQAPAASAEQPKKEKTVSTPQIITPVDLSQDEKAATAAAYLKDVCEKMGVENVQITAEMRGEALILKVEGPDVGALIGRRGETMEALSYLSSLVANRLGGEYAKIGLDVGGYREKREGDLETLAHKVCDKVIKTNRAQMLEPMNPYERRIIHSAVSEMQGVRSESTGEGANRRVVVLSTAEGARNERPDRYDKTTAPRGKNGQERGRPDNKGGFNKGGAGKPRFNNDGPRPPRTNTPPRNFADRARPDAAPTAPTRTETIKDGGDMPLYGKVEF